MADYPRFPKIIPNIQDSTDTFTIGSPGPYGRPAPTKTVSFATAGAINGGAQDALNQMEQWADSLNDKLSADQVQIRNGVGSAVSGSVKLLLSLSRPRILIDPN